MRIITSEEERRGNRSRTLKNLKSEICRLRRNSVSIKFKRNIILELHVAISLIEQDKLLRNQFEKKKKMTSDEILRKIFMFLYQVYNK